MKKKLVLVTGANRGLGYATCRELAKLGYEVILTSREEASGQEAVAKLAEEGLSLHFHQLDTAKAESIHALKTYVEKNFDKLDVLINNAGIYRDGKTESFFEVKMEVVRETFRTNVEGPLVMIQTFAPLMDSSGQIINVSSGMGQLSEMGTGSTSYRISKTALNAVTTIAQAELASTQIHVNSVCPGWVRTDMGGPNAHRSVEQGIDTIVWLATMGEDGPKGQFFRDRKLISW